MIQNNHGGEYESMSEDSSDSFNEKDLSIDVGAQDKPNNA